MPPGTLALPAGYQAGFVEESNPGATLSDANGHALLVGDFPEGSIIASGPSDTMVGGGSTAFFELGGGNDSIVGGGNDTVVGSTGNNTIVTSSSSTLIAPGKGNDLIEDHGSDVVFPGGGSDTIFAFGTVLAGVGSGTLFFINGNRREHGHWRQRRHRHRQCGRRWRPLWRGRRWRQRAGRRQRCRHVVRRRQRRRAVRGRQCGRRAGGGGGKRDALRPRLVGQQRPLRRQRQRSDGRRRGIGNVLRRHRQRHHDRGLAAPICSPSSTAARAAPT